MVDPVRAPSRRAFLAAAGLAVPSVLAAARSSLARQVSVRSGTLGGRSRTVPLTATLDHPQGITASADGTTWFVTSVLRKEQKGVLASFRASDGGVVQRQEVQDGPRYHPGGLGRLGDTLWLPVAEYRRSSTSVVQGRDASTLALRSSFPVADHIGAVAPTPSALIGCNWDARLFYEWTFDGRQVRVVEHDGSARYQDLQWIGDTLVAGGLLGDQGVIDMLEWPTLDLRERIVVGATDRGVMLTHEGLAVVGTDLLLMPEDDPSRVFVHAWAGPPATELKAAPVVSTTEPETSLFRKKPTP